MNNFGLKVFSGRANVPLAEKIAQYLGDPLGKIGSEEFPDGEVWARIDEDVRGRDVFIEQPTCHPVNENMKELLNMLDSMKRAASAHRRWKFLLRLRAPDRKAEGRVPITAKLVANLLSSSGVYRVLTSTCTRADLGKRLFDILLDHLYASPVIMDTAPAAL